MYRIAFILYLFSVPIFARIATNSASNGHTNNRIDNEDSSEDFEYVEEEDYRCVLSKTPPAPSTMCCGVDVTSSDRIVGGSPTLIKQYPWLALIEYRVQGMKKLHAQCGGSLISGLYVLTAAHCVAGNILKKSTPQNVILGDYDKFHDGKDCVQDSTGATICSDGEVRIAIANYTAHSGYSYDRAMLNDIALIKLKTMAPYTDSIRPICLPTSDLAMIFSKNVWLTIAGWGTMSQVRIKGTNNYTETTSAVKRHVRLPLVASSKCRDIWPHFYQNQMCAGGLEGRDACMGDSGGPLMRERDGQFELTGAVSYGASKPCGKANMPGVYTNVYRYKKWIMDQINKK